MELDAIKDYVTRGRAVGMTDDQIRKALLSQGWSAEQVSEALWSVPRTPSSGVRPRPKWKKIFWAIPIVIVALVVVSSVGKKSADPSASPTPSMASSPSSSTSQAPTDTLGTPQPVELGSISSSAAIVYHFEGMVYTMDKNGGNVTQITFERPQGQWEHVAVSYDHHYILANEHYDRAGKDASRMWLFDVRAKTKAAVLPKFFHVGDGGVTWGPDGFMYFSGLEKVNDIPLHTYAWKLKFDGTGLQQLSTINAVDIGVSLDGSLVSFAHVEPESTTAKPSDLHTEIWVVNTDGTNQHAVYTGGGQPKISSVHDPEITDDKKQIVFSKVNPEFHNFADNPVANTAHDLWVINSDGTGLRRLTKPGPISIVPNLKGREVIYFQASEKDNFIGAVMVSIDGEEQLPKKIKPGPSMPKWIPSY